MASRIPLLVVPNVTPDTLQSRGHQGEELRQILKDLDNVSVKLRQAVRLADHAAYTDLRRALAAVRGLEKFDPRLSELVPDLIGYFETRPSNQKKPSTTATSTTSSQTSTTSQESGSTPSDQASSASPQATTTSSQSPATSSQATTTSSQSPATSSQATTTSSQPSSASSPSTSTAQEQPSA